jgi:2-polyprenyl-6-methoxyphenol hydroxylase-like FAD-dependent oxidoreductase
MIGSVIVVGAGMAGLTASLSLAGSGRRVTLVERDPFELGEPLAAPGWTRDGIPHFLQPHAFIPRGRRELADAFPDVYDALLACGAHEVDISAKLPGPVKPADAELRYLAVRRPLIEWALRRAVLAEPRIEVRAPAKVERIVVDGVRVVGVRVDGTPLYGDLVVDAHGRRSPSGWLMGADASTTEQSDCSVVYYSRYYRQRPGFDLPDGPWFLSPRGDLGYLAYASFPGDNRTFAAVLAVPPADARWKVLADPRAYEAAVATIPALRSWADPEGVEPITAVLPMAGLRNTLLDPSPMVGLVRVGDTFSHTDPTLAHGLAFSVIHAFALGQAVVGHSEPADVADAYSAATLPEARERYHWIKQLDEQRLRLWTGQPVELDRHDGAYALFCMAAGGAVARVDPDVFRVFKRRIGLLDRVGVLDDDVAMRERIQRRFTELRTVPAVPAGPSEEEMAAVVSSATR